MKRSVTILLSLLALLVFGLAAQAASQIEVQTTVQFVKDAVIAVAPVAIVSTNITPELIKDLQIKFGKIKVITVVVEQAVYDIDEIPFNDRVAFKELGIDFTIILDKNLDLKERLKPLELLSEFRDNASKYDKAIELANKYTGKELEPGELYQFLVRRPDRGLIKMLLPLAQAGKIDDFADKGVKNLVVGGDMDALEDGLVYMGVVSQLKEMIAPAQSFLSKA
jgi:hypothetical protein